MLLLSDNSNSKGQVDSISFRAEREDLFNKSTETFKAEVPICQQHAVKEHC